MWREREKVEKLKIKSCYICSPTCFYPAKQGMQSVRKFAVCLFEPLLFQF